MKKIFRSIVQLLVCLIISAAIPFLSLAGIEYIVTDLGEGKAFDINSSGQVVGYSGPWGSQAAFLWEDGAMTILGAGCARGVNDFAQVVGGSAGNAVLWEDGSMISLGRGHAYGINDLGQVVGDSLSGEAVLWKNGETIFLQDVVDVGSDFILKTAFAINNKGKIVGYGRMDNEDHAFLGNSRDTLLN